MLIFNSDNRITAYRSLLSAFAAEYNTRERYVFIPSDGYSLECEQDVLQAIGRDSVLNVEVATFSRYAAKRLGDIRCLSPEGAVLLMTKVIYDISSQLLYYSRCSFYPKLVSEIYSTITAIRSSGVTVDSMRELLRTMDTSSLLYKKTHDLCLLTAEYQRRLHLEYDDGTTRLQKLLSYLIDNPPEPNTRFYITGFTTLTAQQLDIIGFFEREGYPVRISVAGLCAEQNAGCYPLTMLSRIRRLCAESDTIAEERNCLSTHSPRAAAVLRSLYSYTTDNTALTEGVTLYEAGDTASEIQQVFQDIKARVARGEGRYRDYAIVCGSISDYRLQMERISRELRLPLHLSIADNITGQSLTSFVIAAMNAVFHRFAQPQLLNFAKHAMLPLSREAADGFENYAVKYNICYNAFTQPFTRGSADEIAAAEQVRSILMYALSPIYTLRGQNTASVWCAAIAEFLERTCIGIGIGRLSKIQEKTNNLRARDITLQMTEKINSILRVTEELLGETQMNVEEFYRLFVQVAATVKVALIPIGVDVVTVREPSQLSARSYRGVYIMGASYRGFPHSYGDSMVLTEKDSGIWKSGGCIFSPTPEDNNRLEKYYALECLITTAPQLTMSYSVTEGDTVNTPSAAFAMLHNMGVPVTSTDAYTIIGTAKPLPAGETLRSVDSRALYFPDDTTSISQLECYAKCPRKHFFDYGIRCREREEGTPNAKLIGTLIHAILERFFSEPEYDETRFEGYVSDLFARELQKEQYAPMLTSADIDILLLGVRQECMRIIRRLLDYGEHSSLEPKRMEARFAKKADFAPLPIVDGDVTILLEGKIDRVDTASDSKDNSKKYCVVFDYKTGSAGFSLKKVYYGTDIQLFSYLQAVEESSDLNCIGTFLIPVKDTFLQEDKEPSLFVGLALDNKETLAIIDSDPTRHEALFGLKYTTKGAINRQRLVTMTADEKDGIKTYLCSLRQQLLHEILGGYIEAKPTATQCTYCEYNSLCAAPFVRQQSCGVKISSFVNAPKGGQNE